MKFRDTMETKPLQLLEKAMKREKTARRLLAVFGVLFVASFLFMGAASTFIEGTSSRAWCITGTWAYSRGLHEWASTEGDTLVIIPATACTVGYFTVPGNHIYVYGWDDGDTSAGKDSVHYSVVVKMSYDTLLAHAIALDTFYRKDSTARGTVFDSLDVYPSDSRGNAKVYCWFIVRPTCGDTQTACLNAYAPNGLVNP